MNDKDLLNDLYYNKFNFDGVDILHKKAKLINKNIKKEFVRDWLKRQSTHQENTKNNNKKIFLPIYSNTPFSFQIDLTFFPRYTKQNDGYYVLFTAININTRYAYAYYSKTKDMITVLDMMKQFKEQALEINMITTDEGTEFTNKAFKLYCEDHNIETYFVKGDSHKLGIINRFHRTIKEKLTKYFSANDSVRWVDIIDKIVYNYNHTVNRGIGIEPYKVNNFIETEIMNEKEAKTNEIKLNEQDFEIGFKCRILKTGKLFDDKMTSKYTNKIYTISRVYKNTVDVMDNEDNEYNIKKTNILLIDNEIEHHVPDNHLQGVKAYNTEKQAKRRSDVNVNLIVNAARIRNPNIIND